MSVTTRLGSRIDLGGQWIGHGHHRFTALAKKAGATIDPTLEAGLPVIVYRGRRVSLLSPSILLGLFYVLLFDVISRVYVPPRWNDVTVKDFIGKWAVTGLTKQFLSFLVTSASTVDLKACSVYHLAKDLRTSGGALTVLGDRGAAQDSLVRESTGSIVDMMARELGAKLGTNARVTSIQQNEKGVTVRTASGQVYTAAKTIITVPPPMLKNISFEPALPARLQALQRNTRMGIVYKAIAVFDRPFWRDRNCSQVISLDDPACGFFDSSPPGGPGHLVLLVTGSAARILDTMSSAQRRDRLLGQLVPFMGSEVLSPLEWHEKSWQTDEFCGGGYLAFPVVGTTEGFLPMPHEAVGNIHRAGTETAQEHTGYIEGALQSGERVAGEVASLLR